MESSCCLQQVSAPNFLSPAQVKTFEEIAWRRCCSSGAVPGTEMWTISLSTLDAVKAKAADILLIYVGVDWPVSSQAPRTFVNTSCDLVAVGGFFLQALSFSMSRSGAGLRSGNAFCPSLALETSAGATLIQAVRSQGTSRYELPAAGTLTLLLRINKLCRKNAAGLET